MYSLYFKANRLVRCRNIAVQAFCVLASAFGLSDSQLAGQDEGTNTSRKIEFNRDIRPILSDRCFQCHGPDEKKREADLRFDLEPEAKKDLGGYFAIKSSDAAHSELISRILSDDPSEIMPPPESGKSLSSAETELLTEWINQGAPFEKHWSFQKPTSFDPPIVSNRTWPKNAIDYFVLSKLEARNIAPSPRADRNALIRRLYFDLIGLAPSAKEVAIFVNDRSPDAYEKLVDRLLDSKHFGERMGRHWLDLARYADSNGYANDGLRSIWPYRDWVINALNADMPFDQFTIEQLAGDLLPPSADPAVNESRLVATGFHRNTPHQTEGGSDFEQYRVERTKNRTDTTGAVWLGLTVGCAQCHTHKFDPITHKEYYQLYAFFNSSDEPTHSLKLTSESENKINELKSKLAAIDNELQLQKKKANDVEKQVATTWSDTTILEAKSLQGATLSKLDDQSILASGKNPTQDTYVISMSVDEPIQSLKLNTLTHPSLPQNGPGRAGNGNFVLAEISVTSAGKPTQLIAAFADHSQNNYDVQDSIDGDFKTGWAINVTGGKLNTDRSATFVLKQPIKGKFEIRMTTYEQGGGYNIGRFKFRGNQSAILKTDPRTAELESTKRKLAAQLKQLENSRPKTLVIRERPKPRGSFVQIRGDFLDPGPTVEPDTLSVLHPFDRKDTTATRLELAKWLISPENPLTPRVQTNRIWQHMFGVGLVETENDFGYQGSLPSHSKLMDFLSTELIRGDWKLKRMYKMIAMSATYQQSSKFRKDVYQVDPKNRLLSKQNRYRVEGEIVRDIGLSTSGLLSKKMGGPSVFPPIPPNVIGTSSANHRWPTSTGEDRYRRAIYTAVYRANVYPMLSAFDGPDRDNACTRRSLSNTPIQALTIANDATFIEMAQAFGKQIMSAAKTDIERIEYAFLSAFSRTPNQDELKRILEFKQQRFEFYKSDAAQTAALSKTNDSEFASWVATARVLMNLDEFITRE